MSTFSLHVAYSDFTLDVLPARSYVKARALFDQFCSVAVDEPEGVLSVELIDYSGRVLASTNTISPGDRTEVIAPGSFVWSEDRSAYVPALNS